MDNQEEEKKFTKAGKRSIKAVQESEKKVLKEEKKQLQAEQPAKIVKPKKRKSKLEKRSKKYKKTYELIDRSKIYTPEEAVKLIKTLNPTKFDATIEVHVALNVDPKHADQNIRDILVLPNGNGKNVKVAVFSNDDKACKEAGADYYGIDTIIKMIEKNNLDFQILITTPTLMPQLSKFARVLGPKGLMPNPKSGTVTNDIFKAISESKAGKIEYRVDSYGIVHVALAKVSFSEQQIIENLHALLNNIKNNKPQSVKSNYLKSIYLTTTMGPSIKLVNEL
jgi:large subunit ribosomal protein L1